MNMNECECFYFISGEIVWIKYYIFIKEQQW